METFVDIISDIGVRYRERHQTDIGVRIDISDSR